MKRRGEQVGQEGWRRAVWRGKAGWKGRMEEVVRKEKQGVIGSRVERREGEQGAKEGWRTGWKGRMKEGG